MEDWESEVVCVRGGEVIGVCVCGHEEVEEDGRDAGALRDTCPRVSLKGGGVDVLVAASQAIHPLR